MKVRELISFLASVDPDMDVMTRWDTEDDGGYHDSDPSILTVVWQYEKWDAADNHYDAEIFDSFEYWVKLVGANKAEDSQKRYYARKAAYKALPRKEVLIV